MNNFLLQGRQAGILCSPGLSKEENSNYNPRGFITARLCDRYALASGASAWYRRVVV